MGLAATVSAVVILEGWVARQVEIVKAAGSLGSLEALPFWAILFGPAAVVAASFLWGAHHLRKADQQLGPGRRVSRVMGAVLAAICLLGWGSAVCARLVFGLSAASATLVAVVIMTCVLVVAGPLVLRRLMPPVTVPELEVRVGAARRLMSAHGLSDDRFVIVAPETREWANALAVGAFPSFARVVLTRRLVEIPAPEEIAAVTAHEIGHIRRRHVGKILLAQGVVVVAASPLLRAAVDYLSGIDSPWVAVGLAAMWMSFAWLALPLTVGLASRRFEFEADAFAAREGYGPALASALTKLNEANRINAAAGLTRLERLLLIHPSLERRVVALQQTGVQSERALWSA